MKKSIQVLATCAFITGIILTGCDSSSQKTDEAQEKVETAQNEVNQANENLDNAKDDYLTDIANYRKETDAKTVANDKIIAGLKTKIDLQKRDLKEDYRRKISELEQKNAELKKKMDDYEADGKENWEYFKGDFNHNMDVLGNSCNNLMTANSN